MRARRSFVWRADGVLVNWLEQPARGRLADLLHHRARHWQRRGWHLRLAEFRSAAADRQRYFLYAVPTEHPDSDLELIDEFVLGPLPARRGDAPNDGSQCGASTPGKEVIEEI